MMRRMSTLTRPTLLAAILSFSSVTLAAENTVPNNPVPGDAPSLDRIKSDASSQFVYTHEGLPIIRGFASSPSVYDAVINSSVREGSLLTLNVSLMLEDLSSGEKRNALARSRMTYRETDGVWELIAMEQNGVYDVAASSQVSADDC